MSKCLEANEVLEDVNFNKIDIPRFVSEKQMNNEHKAINDYQIQNKKYKSV